MKSSKNDATNYLKSQQCAILAFVMLVLYAHACVFFLININIYTNQYIGHLKILLEILLLLWCMENI